MKLTDAELIEWAGHHPQRPDPKCWGCGQTIHPRDPHIIEVDKDGENYCYCNRKCLNAAYE